MIDTVQMAMFDNSMKETMELLGKYLKHVHLGNTRLEKQAFDRTDLNETLTRGMQSYGHIGIGDGELPLEEYLEELAKSNYDGYVTIEICSADYFIEAKKYAAQALELLDGCFEA